MPRERDARDAGGDGGIEHRDRDQRGEAGSQAMVMWA